MKRILLALAVLTAAIAPKAVTAQTLLKDLEPGAHPASSVPGQFTNAAGTMFFITEPTIAGALKKYQLWKSDGSAANTVLVKDSLAVTTLANVVKVVAAINNTIYYTVTPNATTQSHLWKSDGTAAGTQLVSTLTWVGTTGGQPPKNFIVMGTKLYFTFGQNNGRELWVSDGTAAGTMEVVNLATGSSGGIQYPGIEDQAMIVFNGKLYFAGTTGLSDFELFASDGTAVGTTMVYDVRPGTGSAGPEQFIVHNNELYFIASNGSTDNLWKTTGTTTTQLSTGINAGDPIVFKNEIYFIGGIALWKSNGTAAGTVFVKDSISNSGFHGANSAYLFSLYNEFLTVPPYVKAHYKRTDGTAAGTAEVSYKLGASASFNLVNDKMYLTRADSGVFNPATIGIWESDGTEAGTQKLFTATGTGVPFNFNGTLFFQSFTSAVGFEPFYYTLQAATEISTAEKTAELPVVYPNPSIGDFDVVLNSGRPYTVELLDIQGKIVYAIQSSQPSVHVSVPDAKGLYILKVSDGLTTNFEKMVIQ